MPVSTRSQNRAGTRKTYFPEDENDHDHTEIMPPTYNTRSTRKRERPSHSEDYIPTAENQETDPDEYQQPPTKRAKYPTENNTRRSSRIAQKFSEEQKDLSEMNGGAFGSENDNLSFPRRRSQRIKKQQIDTIDENNHNNNIVNNENENNDSENNDDDKENTNNNGEQPTNWNMRLRSRANTNSNNNNNQQNNLASDDDNNDTKTVPKNGDSDYNDADFDQDCRFETDEIDDMAGADEESDENSDEQHHLNNNHEMPQFERRRSQRIQAKKTQVHYYDDGENIIHDVNHNKNVNENNDNVPQNEDNNDNNNNNLYNPDIDFLPISLRKPKRIRKKPQRFIDYSNDNNRNNYNKKKISKNGNNNNNMVGRRRSLRAKKQVCYRELSDDSFNPSNDESRIGVSTRKNSKRSRKRGRASSRRRSKSITYDSGSSSSCSTETYLDRRERRRQQKNREKIKPINIQDLGLYNEDMAPRMGGNNNKNKAKSADVTPMEIDTNVDWSVVGGLEGHVQKLKEMVVLPLLYPNEFAQFNMSTPKGVLFHGPPGTGKTLVARVLAAQCSIGLTQNGQTTKKKVAFYMRKGADCLSKWVGEAERQLRLLFDEASKNQPAVIFFDEIDGLAPVRSSRQDQIHSSIVSTLLALMDGLDNRGQIIVIGATNRPDAIDPALRRPGRFDRELCFNLPSKSARKDILKIHTKSWDSNPNCKLSEELLDYLSEQSVGFCGADLEALCRESFLAAIRRTFPQIYHSNVRLQIKPEKLHVKEEDFEKALKEIVPSSQRSSLVFAKAIPDLLNPLLSAQLTIVKECIEKVFSLRKSEETPLIGNGKQDLNVNKKKKCNAFFSYLISAPSMEYGQRHLGAAVLHLMEEYPMYSLDLAGLYGDSSTKCAEEACLRLFKEARRNTPSVIYWPHIDRWWNTAHNTLKSSIVLLIKDIPVDSPILLVATSDVDMNDLDHELQSIFNEFYSCTEYEFSNHELHAFWSQIRKPCTEKPKFQAKCIEEYETLNVAVMDKHTINMNENGNNDMKVCEDEEQKNQDKLACANLRTYIRAVCNRLCKHFKDFIDRIDVAGGVVENDVSLFDIRENNNEREIPTVVQFLEDIDDLVRNVKESAELNKSSLKARQLVNEACHLQDQALAMISQANRTLVKQCDKLYKQAQNNKAIGNIGNVLGNNNVHNHNNNTNKKRVTFIENDSENDNNILIHSPPANMNSGQESRKSSLRNNCNHINDNEKMSDKREMDMDEDDDVDAEHGIENEVVDIGVDAEERALGLDEKKLDDCIDKLMGKSQGFSVGKLEKYMYSLLRIIYDYSDKWERQEMLIEIENYINMEMK